MRWYVGYDSCWEAFVLPNHPPWTTIMAQDNDIAAGVHQVMRINGCCKRHVDCTSSKQVFILFIIFGSVICFNVYLSDLLKSCTSFLWHRSSGAFIISTHNPHWIINTLLTTKTNVNLSFCAKCNNSPLLTSVGHFLIEFNPTAQGYHSALQ